MASSMLKRFTIALGAVLAAFTIACGGAPSESGPGPEASPDRATPEAVVVTSCKGNEMGLEVGVTVTNHTKKQQSYLITAEALDAKKNRLGEANGAVNSLAAGSSAKVKLLGTLDDTQAVIKTCRIADLFVS